MININCIKRHFGASGALIEVGATSKGTPDGVYWEAADNAETDSNATKGKKLEVATPKKIDDKE